MLSIGAFFLNAASVTGWKKKKKTLKKKKGIDIDMDALEIASDNSKEIEADIDFIHIDILQFEKNLKKLKREKKQFDTVIMNPPFGTKQKGLDMEFLKIATEISDVVYSLHKTSTRNHILKKSESWGFKPKVVAELKYNIENSYKFHKKKSQDIQVDLIRLQKK